MQLPTKLTFDQLLTKWSAILNPSLANPLNSVSILNGVVLKNGATVINHLLGQMQQGWMILDQNAAASIYRSSPFNDKTLTLTSNAVVTVSLGVF
jgi:hypothetical protein